MISLSYLEMGYCCIVIVAAYSLRGSTGFGAAAAMPLLALVVPLKLLVPVWTLLGAASSVTIVAKDHRHIALRELLATLPAGLVGIVIGLYVFTALDTHTLAQGLGALVVAYGCYAFWTAIQPPAPAKQIPKILAPIAGLLGGAIGTTFGTMASIFYAIYFDAIRLAKDRFRATMSAMLLTLSAVRGTGYLLVGEFNLEALVAFAIAFPMMLVGIVIGDRFHAGMTDLAFRRLVPIVLIVSGTALVLK
jgi:uncharacterized membrane protein YfcA